MLGAGPTPSCALWQHHCRGWWQHMGSWKPSGLRGPSRDIFFPVLLREQTPFHLEPGHQTPSVPRNPSLIEARRAVGARKEDGRAGSGWGAPGSGAGMFLGHFPVCPRRSGFLLCQKRFPPPGISQGLGEKGKKSAVKGFPLPFPSISPRGLWRGFGSRRNVWEYGKFRYCVWGGVN